MISPGQPIEHCDPLGGSLGSQGNRQLPWFVLSVRSRFEDTVAAFLKGKGYEWFLPKYGCRRIWSDRIKEVQLPLFPGYVFCRLDIQHRLPVLMTPGVVGIVGQGKHPTPIGDNEIEAIQAAVQSGLPTRPWPMLQVGQKVRIQHGPLEGIEGILVNFKGQHRVALSVSLVQSAIAVDIDAACIVPMSRQDRPGFDLVPPAN